MMIEPTKISQPEKSVSLAVSLMPIWLISAWPPVMMIRKIVWVVRLFSMPSVGPKAPMKKVQVPTLMAPSTVISPKRFSQAVTQPVPRLPRIEPQW